MIQKLIILLAFFAESLPAASLTPKQLNNLRAVAKEFEGVKASTIESFLSSPKLVYVPEVVPKNVLNKQIKNHYKSFHDSYSTHLAKKFKRKWRTRLAAAEKKYGVPKEVIVSVILVETGLGRIKGRYHVPSVFLTLILSSEEQISKLATDDQIKRNKDVNYTKKLARKKEWAKGEWLSLIQMKERRMANVMSIYGSSSGAFGVCQFLPSSYLKYAVDGDGDKRIRLTTFADAIPSVANYLKEHGWSKSDASHRKAVYAYNHSNIYVDTILKVAKTIR